MINGTRLQVARCIVLRLRRIENCNSLMEFIHNSFQAIYGSFKVLFFFK